MAALGKPCRRLPRRQHAASRDRRGAALASAAAAAHSRRVAGGASLRRPSGGRGLRRLDQRTEEHPGPGALSVVAPGLAGLGRARRGAVVCPGAGAVSAGAPGENLRGHAAAGPAALRLVAAWSGCQKGPCAQRAVLRAVAGAGTGDGLVPAAQVHRFRRSRPARGHGRARCRGRMDRLVLPFQAPAAGRPLRHLSALER